MKTRSNFLNWLMLIPLVMVLFSGCSILSFTISDKVASKKYFEVEKYYEHPELELIPALEKNQKPNLYKYHVKLYLRNGTTVTGKYYGVVKQITPSETVTYLIIDEQKVNADEVGYLEVTGKKKKVRNIVTIISATLEAAIISAGIVVGSQGGFGFYAGPF